MVVDPVAESSGCSPVRHIEGREDTAREHKSVIAGPVVGRIGSHHLAAVVDVDKVGHVSSRIVDRCVSTILKSKTVEASGWFLVDTDDFSRSIHSVGKG